MSEPRRPEPERPWFRRLLDRLPASGRDLLSRRSDEAPAAEDQPLLLVAITAIGSAALALGSLWAWQAWSQRSAEPIDDRLPMLVAPSASTPDEDDVGGRAADTADGEQAPSKPDPVLARDARPNGDGAADPAAETPENVVVHVSGEVVNPGIVTVPGGARVNDAVEAAGGAHARADLDRVNLAALVVDGERIHVPAVGEAVPDLVPTIRPPLASGSGGVGAVSGEFVVDLNSAGQAELERLPGVGPATALAILETRERRGPFLSVDELLDVDGIGPAKLEELRAHVTVHS